MTSKTSTYDSLKKYLFVFTLLTAILLLSSCNDKNGEDVKYLIGVAHADLSEDWQLALDTEISNQIRGLINVEVITTNANGSTFKQVKDLQTLMDYGVDLIIVTPNDKIVMKREVAEVYKEIPVIVMNRELPGKDYSMFIGPDFHDIGLMMGGQVIQHADGLPANVIELKGPFNDMSVDGMTKGFHQAIRSSKNIQLYREFAADWKKDDAMDWYLTSDDAFPEGNVTVAHNQAMAEGIHEARTVLGKEQMAYFAAEAITGKGDSMEIAFDNDFAYMVKWQLGGVEAVHYALNILKGSENIPQTVILNNYNLSKDNYKTFIEEQKSFAATSIKKLGLVHSGVGTWNIAQTESLEAAVQPYNIDIYKTFTDTSLTTEGQLAEQIQAVYGLLESEVDAIVLSPVVSAGWDGVFEIAKAREVPIVVINNPVEGVETEESLFIGYDGLREGELMANWIIDSLYGEEDIQLAVIGGSNMNLAHRDRMEGIESIIDEYSRINTSNDWASLGGRIEDLDMLLSENESINAVLVLEEDFISKTLNVLRTHEKKAEQDIRLLCFGDVGTYESSLLSNEIDCMVGRSSDTGTLILESLEIMLESPYSPKAILISNDIVSY